MRTDLSVVLAGVIAGLGSAPLFRWVSARIPRVDLWGPAAILARSLVVDAENENFFAQYFQLLKLLARYLGRQVLTMALPLGAVAAIAILVLPALAERSNLHPANGDSSARSEGPLSNIHIPTLAESEASSSVSPVFQRESYAQAPVPDNSTSDPFAETIVPVAAQEERSRVEKSEQAAPQLATPASADEESRLLPFGLNDADVTFFMSLCVGSAFGAILPLRKK